MKKKNNVISSSKRSINVAPSSRGSMNVIPFPGSKVEKPSPLNLHLQILAIIEKQNQAFDNTIRLVLGHLADKKNVRDVINAWEKQKEEVEEMIEDLQNELEKEGEDE